MCPMCLGTAILIAAGLSSAGGVIALAKGRFVGESDASKNSPPVSRAEELARISRL